MARASAILRCLALVSRHAPDDQEIDLAEIVDVVYQLIDRAIDRLDEVSLLNAIGGRAVARDDHHVSPVAAFGGTDPPATPADAPDRTPSDIAAYTLAWLDQRGVLHEDHQLAFPTAEAAEQASTHRNSELRKTGDEPVTLVVGRLALIPRQRRVTSEPVPSRTDQHSRGGPESNPST